MKKAIFGLFVFAVALVSAGIAKAAPTIYDHFDNSTFADSAKWMDPVNPAGIFTEPAGSYMVASKAGNENYTRSDRSYLVSQLVFAPEFRGGAGLYFQNFSYTFSGDYPTQPNVNPNIGIGFAPAANNTIGIYRGYMPGTDGVVGDWIMFMWRKDNLDGSSNVVRYFMDASNITSGLLYVDRRDDGIHAGYSPNPDGGDDTQFEAVFKYSEYPGYNNPTRLFVAANPAATGSLYAEIDFVGYQAEPVPLPPSVLLLAPGLFGLAIMKRKFGK